jgi:hypothetical protein
MDDIEKDRREDQLVVAELGKIGVHVSSTQDFMNTREPYPEAIPVLLEMLPKMQGYALKEVIVRSLGVKEAKGRAEPLLIAEFGSSLPDDSRDASSLRWAIANTFDILGGGKDASESLLQFLTDSRSGRAREMLSLAAAKSKNRAAIPILLDLLEIDNFTGFAAEGLGILRAEEAISKLKLIVEGHSNAWVRRQAKTALKRLGVSVG